MYNIVERFTRDTNLTLALSVQSFYNLFFKKDKKFIHYALLIKTILEELQ
jgi:hypothetical protein